MKTTFLLLSLLAFGLTAKAQTNSQISNCEWKEVLATCWVDYPTYQQNYYYDFTTIKSEGDTTIAGLEYVKLYEEGTYAGALRNDSCRFYFFSPKQESEFVLYDFCVTDSFFSTVFQKSFYVTSIDSIMIGNEYRKRINFENSAYEIGNFWIDGVGSSSGLLKPTSYTDIPTCERCCGIEQNLICYSKNDELLYLYNDAYDCDSLFMNAKEITAIDKYKVYPNPTKGNFTIESMGNNQLTQIEIFTIDGRLLQKYPTKTIRNPQFYIDKPGIYLLRLTAGHAVISKKIIVE